MKSTEWDGLLDLHVVGKFMAAMETQQETQWAVCDGCAALIGGARQANDCQQQFSDQKCKECQEGGVSFSPGSGAGGDCVALAAAVKSDKGASGAALS